MQVDIEITAAAASTVAHLFMVVVSCAQCGPTLSSPASEDFTVHFMMNFNEITIIILMYMVQNVILIWHNIVAGEAFYTQLLINVQNHVTSSVW